MQVSWRAKVRSYLVFFNIGIIALLIFGPIALMPYFARFSRSACGEPKYMIGDVARGYTRVDTWTEMNRLIDEAVTRWRSAYPDAYKAWCESKVDRLRQNVRSKVNTVTEVDRNVEHYLFARQFVSEVSWPLKPVFYGSAVYSITVYSLTKWIRGDVGSPPTPAEFYHAQRGAWHGIWD